MTAPLADTFQDAMIAARLCAIDPALGGIVLRGGDNTLRDLVIAEAHANMRDDAPHKRLPVHIDDDRLLGGIDLTATLASGRAVMRTGLLAEADCGLLVVPMAERLPDAVAGRIAAALDTGTVAAERDGTAIQSPARLVTVALDDSCEPDAQPPAALTERLAFWIDLSGCTGVGSMPDDGLEILSLPTPEASPDVLDALIGTAGALGIESARAGLFALRAARAAARMAGRDFIDEADASLAARLVLAPRATRLPAQSAEAEAAPPPPPETEGGEEEHGEPVPLDDIVLAAALAALPKDVLARIAAGSSRRNPSRVNGAGERRKSMVRGRPLGARLGKPGGGRRLSLIDTLRAAAPWQRLRGREERILIRRDDLRVRRFETRAPALTIFAVDASGSSALARLAEAKGAVELLLAEAYVKRAEVALIAFRGTGAELLLPPTRSLARARRSLAELPGGGGTPLAAGLHAARDLAESARTRGRTPFLVVLTDGRANVAADGTPVRIAAEADANAAARAIGAAGIAAAFVDISVRTRPEGAAMAAAMGARYLPLPRADAVAMHKAVSAARPG